jgi:hypothetical protein
MASTHNRSKTIKFGCHDTRRNLPIASSSKRGESNFVAKFEKAYLASELKKFSTETEFATGREFALNGFGRADMLFMAWSTSSNAQDFTALALKSLKLTAFEAKLKDWRKGLMQASQYRFFANRAVLVLPSGAAATAIGFLEAFRALNVGLWEFDTATESLKRHFTPRLGKPLNTKAREKAIHLISSKLKFR